MTFIALGLSPHLDLAAASQGLTEPTPIQQQAIPAVLRGADVLGIAQTGSGKTAAYVLPLLQRLQISDQAMPKKIQVLVLVPTRELAVQVGDVFAQLAQPLPVPLKIVSVFGGVSINPQMMELRGGADVVIATTGRLLDLIEHNALKLSFVDSLVLDEADRLFDLGFAEELHKIFMLLPEPRQNLFFSATFPEAVKALTKHLLKKPVRVDVMPTAETEPDIIQRVILVDTLQRTQLLIKLVKDNDWSSVLVFVATKYAAEHVAAKLQKAGLYAAAFHGDLSQGARTEVLDGLKAGGWQVVVTTDLASRGLDVPDLPVVINFDAPRSAVDYVHRIGRTGRAGATGVAISFVSASTEAHFRLIEKRNGLSLTREQVEGFEPVEVQADAAAAPSVGGIKGKRPNKKDKLRAAAAQALETNEHLPTDPI
jgi:ATP-dependent RNA helicase RhlE